MTGIPITKKKQKIIGKIEDKNLRKELDEISW